MPVFHKGFQSVLYHKLIYRKEHDVQSVAQKMGVSASALYAYAEGERTFPPDLIPALYLATGDEEFLQFFLQGTGFVLSRLPGSGQASPDLRTEVLEVMGAVGTLAETVNAALADKAISEQEALDIDLICTQVQRATQDVHSAVERPEWARGRKLQ